MSDYVDCKDGGSGEMEWESGDLIHVEVGVETIMEVAEASGEFVFSTQRANLGDWIEE